MTHAAALAFLCALALRGPHPRGCLWTHKQVINPAESQPATSTVHLRCSDCAASVPHPLLLCTAWGLHWLRNTAAQALYTTHSPAIHIYGWEPAVICKQPSRFQCSSACRRSPCARAPLKGSSTQHLRVNKPLVVRERLLNQQSEKGVNHAQGGCGGICIWNLLEHGGNYLTATQASCKPSKRCWPWRQRNAGQRTRS